jgi:hypothetical protein
MSCRSRLSDRRNGICTTSTRAPITASARGAPRRSACAGRGVVAEQSAQRLQPGLNEVGRGNARVQVEAAPVATWRVVHVPEWALRPGDAVLLREEVFPVCSPDLYQLASQALCRCRLLQEARENSPEVDWRNWASALGLPPDLDARIVRPVQHLWRVDRRRARGRGCRSGPVATDRSGAARYAPGVLGPGAVAARLVAVRPAPRTVAAAPHAGGADRLPACRGRTGNRCPPCLTQAPARGSATVCAYAGRPSRCTGRSRPRPPQSPSTQHAPGTAAGDRGVGSLLGGAGGCACRGRVFCGRP